MVCNPPQGSGGGGSDTNNFVLTISADYLLIDNTNLYGIFGANNVLSTQNRRLTNIPVYCTLKRMDVRIRINSSQTVPVTIIVQTNLVSTAFMLSIPANEGEASYSLEQDLSISAGDSVVLLSDRGIIDHNLKVCIIN